MVIDGVMECVGVTVGVIDNVIDGVGVIEGVGVLLKKGVFVGVFVGVILTMQHLRDRGRLRDTVWDGVTDLVGLGVTWVITEERGCGTENNPEGKLRLLAQGYDPTVTTDVDSICIFSFISLSVSDNIIFHNSLLFIYYMSFILRA